MNRLFGDVEQPTVVGLFGAGHLGRTIAQGLMEGGVDRSNIRICHGGSDETRERLEKANLDGLVVSPEEVCSRANVLLYLVRPGDFMTIGNYSVGRDCTFISFLGGISTIARRNEGSAL